MAKKSKGRSPYITGPGGAKAPTAPVKRGPGGTYITGPGGAGRERVPEMRPCTGPKGVQRGGDKRPYITGPGGAQKKSSYPIELPMHNVSIKDIASGAVSLGRKVGKAVAGHFDKSGEIMKEIKAESLKPETGPTTSPKTEKKKEPEKEKRTFGARGRKVRNVMKENLQRKREALSRADKY